MAKFTINNAETQAILSGKEFVYPKYTTQIMNLANQNAQGTRPNVVGQMSELIQEFSGSSLNEWEAWYISTHPEAFEIATKKIYEMIKSLKVAIEKVDEDLVRKWVGELVIVKTYSGMKFQEAIISKIAQKTGSEYRLAQPNEESMGIDGFIGGKPISIKPSTYKTKTSLNENIDVPIVYYEKKKAGITVEYEPSDF